jgi:hypothetical protein
MTSLALAENGSVTPLDPVAKPIRDRIRQGRAYRRTYMEPTWQLNLAYASGKQWLGWHDSTRTLRTIQELDPRYRGRELYTADVITEYRTTALGELGSDNDLPSLLLRRDDQMSEDYQAQLNRALEYGWDMEWDGDDVLAQVDRFVVDLGTAAVRCRYDPATGPVVADNVPHVGGMPVLDPNQAMGLMQNGPNPDVTMQPVRQGKICWEPLSCFDLIVPPGAVHESQFPWECVVRPVYLPDVQERYGDVALSLKEDGDISTGLGLSTMSPSMSAPVYAVTDAKSNRLRDHVWLFDWYERPTKKSPQGRVFTFASNELKLIDHQPSLPYQAPDGSFRSGIAYFHWWRVTGRFWSRSLVDVLRDGQRGINKRRTQINEIIDRNMPFVIVQTDSKAKRKSGLVNEIVEVDPQERAPQVVTGTGPGQWMQADVEAMREDLVHASGINGPRRGENPQNVTTYSQLSLINELDSTKREQIYLERKRAISQLVEDTITDIRAYWGPAKQLALAGDDDRLEPILFDATRIPTFFIVKIGKGSAKPRSQAAEIQKISDIWTAALNAQAAMQNPGVWVRWYKDSLDAGEALELPAEGVEDPGEKAELENHYLLQGVPMPIAYYDIHQAHLVRHRLTQDQALFAQDMRTWQLVEQHCQLHMNAMQAQAEQEALQQASLPGGAAGLPPGPAGAGAPGPGQASPPAPPGPVTPSRANP